MNNIVVLSSKISKDSAGELSKALSATLEFPYDTKSNDFTKYDYVFKYGVTKKIKAKKGVVFNKSKNTSISINKISTFNALKDLDITVPYTQDITVARQWLLDGHTVVARSQTKGSNGSGITYCTTAEELYNTPAKFWTRCIYENQELRVNIWRDKVLSIYVKVRDTDTESFVFKLHKGFEEHPQLVNMTKLVYSNIGLDFCGLDILTDNTGKLLLLEVNSAPILFPYTINKLVGCIKKEISK
jgi:glutathione synthase/RimK-type ligase-like ATP-grasp enzyme